MRPLLIIFTSIFIFGCSEEKEPPNIPSFEEREISISEKMKIAVSKEYISQIGLPDSTVRYLKDYYSQRDYIPRWINDSMITNEGAAMKGILNQTFSLGIPLNRIYFATTDNYIQDEINLTISLAQIIGDLQHGFVDYDTKLKKSKMLIPFDKLDSLLAFDFDSDLRLQFLRYGPSDSTYQVLGKCLISIIDSFPLDKTTFDIKSIKYDTLDAVKKTRKALFSKGYIPKNINDSIPITESLKRFQKDNGLNPDGVIGKYTSEALNESTYHKIERIILSMDKIRDRTPRPNKYIYINIPEFKLRYYINDVLKSEHNIIVGKYTNQTPELTSKLRKIVAYPYWNIPYSISSKEILPHLKQSVSYMEKHNYKLLKKEVEINPDSVDWNTIKQNSFPFRIRQEPGPNNSLGIIKFDFYNKHSVYFHDTPSKSLFSANVRAYSHGCMRTQNPVRLAKIILENDEHRNRFNGVISDSLDSIFSRGVNHEIKLLSPVPIFIEYQSVSRNKENIVIYLDIYDRDEEYLIIMRK
ncbi:MAG: L,D-transpeptidase family protein [Crocinitomicaceae bacterium]